MAVQLGFQNHVFLCSHDRTTSFIGNVQREKVPDPISIAIAADRPAGFLDPNLCRGLGRLHIITHQAENKEQTVKAKAVHVKRGGSK